MKPQYTLSKSAFWILSLMTLFALIYNIFIPLHDDAAVYWQWSRHLALSYYDGAPLTAYLLKISTSIFGISAWSVNLVAVICMTTAVYYIYLLARELFDAKVALYALLIILTMPLTQVGYVICTLDPTLICFWSMSLFYFYAHLRYQKTRYLYIAGLCLGLCLLAKYSGVLLGASLFIFLLFSKYRSIFKNPHLYIAAIIALLVFSPVIIWNWQHHWIAFNYQLDHGIAQQKHFQLSLMLTFLANQLGVSNPVFFISFFYFTIRHFKKLCKDAKLRFVAINAWFVFLFFFYQGVFKYSEANWAAPTYVCGSILVAYFVAQLQGKLLRNSIIIVGIVLAVLLRFPILTPFLPKQAVLLRYVYGFKEVAAEAAPYYDGHEIVLSNRKQSASEMAFYMPGRPQTYILDQGQVQYWLWSQKVLQQIKSGKIKTALYVGEKDQLGYAAQYFKHQKLLKNINYNGRWISRQWQVIKLWN